MSETVIKARAVSEVFQRDPDFLTGPHLEIFVHNASGIRNSSKHKALRRPFIMVIIGNQRARTKSKKKTLDPVYNESLYFSLAGIDISKDFNMTFECYDRSNLSIAHKLLSIGGVSINFKELITNKKMEIHTQFIRGGGNIKFTVYAQNIIVTKKKLQSDCDRLLELQQRQESIDSFLKSKESQQNQDRVQLLQEKVLVQAKVQLMQEKILEARRLRVATLQREQEEHNAVLSELRRAIEEEEKRQIEEQAEEDLRVEQERIHQEQEQIRLLQSRREQRTELHRQRTERSQIKHELDKLEQVRMEQEKVKEELARLEEQKRIMKQEAELEFEKLQQERQRLEEAVLEEKKRQEHYLKNSPRLTSPSAGEVHTIQAQQEKPETPLGRTDSALMLKMKKEEQERKQREVEEMLQREEQEYLLEQTKFKVEKKHVNEPVRLVCAKSPSDCDSTEITADLIQSVKLKKTTPKSARESVIWKNVFG